MSQGVSRQKKALPFCFSLLKNGRFFRNFSFPSINWEAIGINWLHWRPTKWWASRTDFNSLLGYHFQSPCHCFFHCLVSYTFFSLKLIAINLSMKFSQSVIVHRLLVDMEILQTNWSIRKIFVQYFSVSNSRSLYWYNF